MYLIGYDVGSSSIKVALIRADDRSVVGVVQYPDQEMDMISRQRGWAEQQPEVWWQNCCSATRRLLAETKVLPSQIQGIGIAYQMHGLVLVDEDQRVLRPAIIWCDSRAVPIGEQAFEHLGTHHCLEHLLNSPGNFTASRLKWVKDNEPEIYEKAAHLLLPGDYIAMRFTGEVHTTVSGLSEGIFWDFKTRQVSQKVLDHFDLREDLLAPCVPTFSLQGRLHASAAEQCGLAKGTPVTYRAGDQPNNAFSLNVLHPGEIAATSGTSGVVYGIVDRPIYDPKSRVNAFAHVNYEQAFNRIGVLLCLNGAGIQYSWLKHQVARGSHSYIDMERMATSVPVGADGLCVLPFGNGAERMLENRELNAHIHNLQFNRHTRGHVYRAALEGVAFSFVYGINILKEMNLDVDIIRVANDNMFQSKVFSTTLATLLDCEIEVMETTGAIGAAKAAGIAVGAFKNLEEATANAQLINVFEPTPNRGLCEQAYSYWLSCVEKSLVPVKSSQRASVAVAKQNKRLDKELRLKNRSLAAQSLQLVTLKEQLAEIEKELGQIIALEESDDKTKALKKLKQRIGRQLTDDSEWHAFEEHFNILHDNFFHELKAAFPQLTIPELKMCAYLKMGLSSKEMSQRLNISLRGVETRRYRLGKKLDVSNRTRLSKFLKRI